MAEVYNSYLNSIVAPEEGAQEITDTSIISCISAAEAQYWDTSGDEPVLVTNKTGIKGIEMVYIINCSTPGDLTVKAGNGIQGAKDLTIAIDDGISVLRLEPGKFLQTKAYIDDDAVSHIKGTVEFQGDGTFAGEISCFSLVYGEDLAGGGGGK